MTCRLLIWGLVLLVGLGPSPASEQTPGGTPAGGAPSDGYERPSAGAIHSTADEILADPRYKPHKTALQWFMEHLRNWHPPELDAASGWVGLLFWVFIAWCVVTLVAIGVHIGWTLFTMLRPARSAAVRAVGMPGLHEHLRLPYDALLALAREAADGGSYREALHWTMLALLRYLADRDLIALHLSKTNGDYVRELSAATGAGTAMAAFAADFDRYTYGAAGCWRGDYALMTDALERIQLDVTRQT